MKIHLRSKQFALDEIVRASIERRLQLSLGRYSLRVHRVTVQIIDANGPRGGEDKVCRIEARLLPTGSIFVEDTDADLYVAVYRAAERMARSLSRVIKRTQDFERDATPRRSLVQTVSPSDTEEQPVRMDNRRRRADTHPHHRERRGQRSAHDVKAQFSKSGSARA